MGATRTTGGLAGGAPLDGDRPEDTGRRRRSNGLGAQGAPTRAEAVADYLRESIFKGELAAGTRIRLTDTARSLGVSEMPVRDALRLLETEQLVTVLPRRGATVTQLSPDDIEELYAMRAGLEGLAARLAVNRMDRETAVELEELFARMAQDQASSDPQAFVTHDRMFHRTLYEAAGRPRLVTRILGLWDNSRRAMPIGYRAWFSDPAAVESHRIILAAVLARNPTAAEHFVREHTDQAAARIIDSLKLQDSTSRTRHRGPARTSRPRTPA